MKENKDYCFLGKTIYYFDNDGYKQQRDMPREIMNVHKQDDDLIVTISGGVMRFCNYKYPNVCTLRRVYPEDDYAYRLLVENEQLKNKLEELQKKVDILDMLRLNGKLKFST